MADKLRPDELAAFKAAFDMFDKNQDGTISTKVKKHLSSLYVYSENVEDVSYRNFTQPCVEQVKIPQRPRYKT